MPTQEIQYFTVSSSDTISLASDVVTDTLLFTQELISSWSIQSESVSGTDGTPTYTLQVSPVDNAADFKDFDSLIVDLNLDTGVRGDAIPYLYVRLSIKVNDNTTGTTKFSLTKITL